MPIVTITVRAPKPTEFKRTVLDAVHAALVAAGVNRNDLFQRVLELPPDDFRFDATFPDLARPRTADFVLIEILLGIGRSVKVKRAIVKDTVEGLAKAGLDPEHDLIVVPRESDDHWSILRRLLAQSGTGGNLVTDAHVAAITIGHGARLATCDRDFARFEGLRMVSPMERR